MMFNRVDFREYNTPIIKLMTYKAGGEKNLTPEFIYNHIHNNMPSQPYMTKVNRLDAILKKQKRQYGMLVYAIDPSAKTDEFGIAFPNPLDRDRSTVGGGESQVYATPKFCIPQRWKNPLGASLKTSIVRFVEEFETGTLFQNNEDSNKHRHAIVTHCFFVPRFEFRPIFKYQKRSYRVNKDNADALCKAIMIRGVHDCFMFDLNTELEDLKLVARRLTYR